MSGGTVEQLAYALALALEPLRHALAPGEAPFLMAELGLAIPAAVLARPGPAAALGTVRDAAAALPDLVEKLGQALESGDAVPLGAAVIAAVADLVDGLGAIGDALAGEAATVPGIPAADAAAFAASLPTRILDLALIGALEARAPNLANILALAGLIERRREPGNAADPTRPEFELRRLHLDRLGSLLQSPEDYFRALYGWGGSGFDGRTLFAQIANLADHLGLPSLLIPPAGAGGGLTLDLLAVALSVDPAAAPPGLGIALRAPVSGNFQRDLPLPAEGWRLRLASEVQLDPGLVATAVPPGRLTVTPPAPPLGSGALRAVLERRPATPDGRILLLGTADGTRLEAAEITASLAARLEWDGAAGVARGAPVIDIDIRGGRFVLSLGGDRGPIGALVPAELVEARFDFGLGWADGKLFLKGGVGLEATFPVDFSFGPVDLHSVTLGLSPGGGGALPIEISATLGATLGPLSMLVERIGLTARIGFPSEPHGNLGPVNLAFAFRPPSGIGLGLDAGPVSGGGHLSVDPSGARYGGALQLRLSFIGVTAYGIYEEAGGEPSFAAVLGIRFRPGIQLGFGFALTGVGGFVGLNRRANVDLLRDRLASGAAGNVLFSEDPVREAPVLLNDLAVFFPPAPGTFLIGPTLQISWLDPIVRLDVGLLIELPGPSKIILLGTVRATLGIGGTAALLALRMDILGAIDFGQRLLSIDAQLVDSHALGIVRLTGGMAFRLAYGVNPYVLLSVGGFHPRFDPGPLAVPRLARVGGALDLAVLARIYVRLELYVAFTSNTLQAGARVEAGMELGPIQAHGHFVFDALIQFRPFHFDLEFAAGFDVEVFDLSLCNITIEGRITGPGPVVIHARGSVRRLFLKVSGSATFELGESNADRPAPIEDALDRLAPELSLAANLRTEGEDRAIVLRPAPAAGNGVLVSPRGALIFEQKKAPLKTRIDRLEGVPLARAQQFELTAEGTAAPAGDELDWFTPGAFTNLDLAASQTLNNAGFQELPSGIRLGAQADAVSGDRVEYLDTIDLVKRPSRSRFADLVAGAYLSRPLHTMMAERSTAPGVAPGSRKVTVRPETADVVAADDGTVLAAGTSPFQAFQLARGAAGGGFAVPSAEPRVVL